MKKISLFATMLLIALSVYAAPEGEWEAIGTGRYYEDLFPVLNSSLRGLSWEVAVEKSTSEDGWYRFAPYSVPSAVTEAYGGTDDTWFYLNATDPEKVYFEVATVFGRYEFSQVVPECGYRVGDRYATLSNNIVSWPRISVRVTNLVDMSECYETNTCLNTEMSLVLPTPGGNTEKWSDLGEVEFVDGILSPMLNATAPLLRVHLMERNDAPGYYKLVNPWQQYGGNEDFLIDATDPDFVTCPLQEAGFDMPEYGPFAMASAGATWVHDSGISKDEFRNRFPELVVTLRNGIISFPPNSVVFNFPQLDFTHFYSAEHPSIALVALPGHHVSEVGVQQTIVDTTDLPVEYYNLQGVRIAAPNNGICIRRQGSTATIVCF